MNHMLQNRVQAYRKEHSLTQESLGDAVGVTRQTIIAIEKGNYTPSVTLAMNIAAVFGVPVEDVFYFSPS